MKRFLKTATFIVAMFGISFATIGCGGSKGGDPSMGVPAPGYTGAVIPIPGGGAQVIFSGQNVWNSNIFISGGSANGASKCNVNYCYCGHFNLGTSWGCWVFSNMSHPSGTVTVGGAALPVGTPNTLAYTGSSQVEPGASATLVASYPNNNVSQTVTGTITIPPNFIKMNFPSGLPPIVGLSFDFAIASNNSIPMNNGSYSIEGGVLLFTGAAQGAFLMIDAP